MMDWRFLLKHETIQKPEKALLVGFYLKKDEQEACEDSLEELEGLAHTYGAEVIDKVA